MTRSRVDARHPSDDGLVRGSNDDAVIGWIREIVLSTSAPWRLASFLGRGYSAGRRCSGTRAG